MGKIADDGTAYPDRVEREVDRLRQLFETWRAFDANGGEPRGGDSRPRRGVSLADIKARILADDGREALTLGEANRIRLERLLANARKPPTLRFKRGAMVAESYAHMQYRRLFTHALYKWVPAATTDLVNAECLAVEERCEALRLESLHAAAQDPILGALPYSDELLQAESPAYAAAVEQHWAIVDAWQERYGLHDEWAGCLASRTIELAREMHEVGLVYEGPIALNLGESWRVDYQDNLNTDLASRPVDMESGRPVYPVFVEDLKRSPDEPWFDMYDPESESIDLAVQRISNALLPRVRAVLEAIADENRNVYGALVPVPLRKSPKFEWLVRFQVLRESRRQISYSRAKSKWAHRPGWEDDPNIDPYATTSHVGREIRKAAKLIGLTLRDDPEAVSS